MDESIRQWTSPAGTFDFINFLGFPSEPPDAEDELFEADPSIEPAEAIDLRDAQRHGLWGPVYSQYGFNSCVANAAAALLTFEWNKSHVPSNSIHNLGTLPSRVYIWYNARAMDPKFHTYKGENNGCHNRLAMKSLFINGACRESFCRYPLNNDQDDMNDPTSSKFHEELDRCYEEPTPEAKQDGESHFGIARYERLDIKLPRPQEVNVMEECGDELKKNVCQALSEEHPVLFDFFYYQLEGDQLPYQRSDGSMVMRSRPQARRHTPQQKGEGGSHTVLAVGYDDKYVKCLTSLVGGRNPFGDNTWPDGCFLMPWDRVTDFEATEDYWVIKGFQNMQQN